MTHTCNGFGFGLPYNSAEGPGGDVAAPGTLGFGVDIAPSIPADMSEMIGTNIRGHDNYGNYQVSDGSIMVWIPAFFYKWGTGLNGLSVNDISIQPRSAFPDVATANAAGYALHRAFYDGGVEQPGVFIDKYMCSNNAGTASSIALGAPLSTNIAHNPIGALTGTPANNNGGVFAAAKTRGADYFPCSRQAWSAMAMLQHAHAQASTSTEVCAWYDPAGITNFPKGNNNKLVLNDWEDNTVTFTGDGFNGGTYLTSLTGSGIEFAKTAHNGQNCGITDVNGNMYEAQSGITYGTVGADTGYWVLKQSVALKSLTGGVTLATDAFGPTGIAANYDFAGASFGYLSASGGPRNHRFGNGSAQVLSEAVSGLDWQMAGLAIPLAAGASAGGDSRFGLDWMYDTGPSPINLMISTGGGANLSSQSGSWALLTNSDSMFSHQIVSFRCARYL